MATQEPKPPLSKFPPEYLQILAHYYRAEIYRSSVWRTRLDVTTNWAILAMTAAFSWSFTGTVAKTHIVFPITSLIVSLLLFIEARRYRYYDVWWTRARLLEAHLVVPALNPDLSLLQGDWREFLSNDLLLPAFKISLTEAIARRLASTYIYIYLLLGFGWFLRVYSGAKDADGNNWIGFGEFYASCEYEFLNAGVILVFQIFVNLNVLAMLLFNWHGRYVSGEIRRKDPNSPSWPI